MSYAKKLAKQFKGLETLKGGALQKRRDKLNRAGVHHEKSTASFSTHVKGTEKRKGCSKPPKPL